MKNPPNHIKNAGDFEPLYPPQEFILEESLRREAERVVHQENLLNRVVYDSIDPSPYTGAVPAEAAETGTCDCVKDLKLLRLGSVSVSMF